MNCLFCNNDTFKRHHYPKTFYNNKLFNYVRCTNCRLIQVSPLPVETDLIAMYPSSYQSADANTTIYWRKDTAPAGLRFSYKKHLDLISSHIPLSGKLLDYGCGDGNFLVNAKDYGFLNLYGAEFGSDITRILQNELSGIHFMTIDDLVRDTTIKYDCIRLSNVLEHLTNPAQVMQLLKSKLNDNGIIVIEGPMEDNFYPMNVLNHIYFNISYTVNPERTVNHPPYHVFLSNLSNQKRFFSESGFKTVYLEVMENSWPYPNTLSDAKDLKSKIFFLLSKVSQKITSLFNKTWGNTILYIGK